MKQLIRDLTVTTLCALIAAPALILSTSHIGAQVMQSNSYRIESDSVNFSGGLSSSTNYTLESTAGEIATGESGSTNFNLKAGYQQMVTNFISMTTPADVIMTPSISGITGGTSNGSTTVTVTTDSPAGYSLRIAATDSPTLQKGVDAISDYVPAGASDFMFTVNSGEAFFGYSPEGIDIVSQFRDDGASCGAGVLDTPLACWSGLSTSPAAIAESSAANVPNGATTTVHFRVGLGASTVQAEGVYTGTTTLTAISL